MVMKSLRPSLIRDQTPATTTLRAREPTKVNQTPFRAPSWMDSMGPGQPAAHAGYDAMVNGCGALNQNPVQALAASRRRRSHRSNGSNGGVSGRPAGSAHRVRTCESRTSQVMLCWTIVMAARPSTTVVTTAAHCVQSNSRVYSVRRYAVAPRVARVQPRTRPRWGDRIDGLSRGYLPIGCDDAVHSPN